MRIRLSQIWLGPSKNTNYQWLLLDIFVYPPLLLMCLNLVVWGSNYRQTWTQNSSEPKKWYPPYISWNFYLPPSIVPQFWNEIQIKVNIEFSDPYEINVVILVVFFLYPLLRPQCLIFEMRDKLMSKPNTTTCET